MSVRYSPPAGEIPGDAEPPAVAGALSLATGQVDAGSRPYPPSWVDQLTDWVRRLPLPAWAFYMSLGLGLALLLSLGGWLTGVLAGDTFRLVLTSALSALTFAYLLALLHFLDDFAGAALARSRPVLTVGDAGYDRLRYQLTTLPARLAWVASGIGALYEIASLLLNTISQVKQGSGVMSPLANAVDVAFGSAIYVVAGVLVYHTLHQLRVVNEIYTRHTRIDIFQPGPLYALSGLTAATAIGMAIPTYAWFQVSILSSPEAAMPDIFQAVFLGIVAVVTFIWPLLGAHNLLEREKQRLRDEVGGHIAGTIAALNSRVVSGELGDADKLKDTLEALVAEQGVINKLRTWPWSTEMSSGLGLAFLLPMLLWVLQRVLERLGV